MPSRPALRDLAKALPSAGRVILCTHRHPDPDGLGALLGMQYLLATRFGLIGDLVLEGRIRRAENAAMRDLLGIRALPKGGVNPSAYGGLLLVDSQPGFSHTHPPGGLPLLAVVDHHDGPERGEGGAASRARFEWVDTGYGATSAMVYDLLRAFDLKPDERVATGLFCGVRYDTNDLQRGASEVDVRAYQELEALANRHIVAEIDHPPLPRAWYQQMHTALAACRTHGPLSLTLLGEVPSPEAVAEVADWLLRLEGQTWSLAGGACDGLYQVSLRTDQAGADAYPMLRAILDGLGSCGGHGRMAGGQVPLADQPLDALRERIAARALAYFDLQGVTAEAVVPGAASVIPPGAPR